MSSALKERLKNLIIFILILTGIIQVGILFGYQSQGTPTNFILGLFNKSSQVSSAETKEKLFVPNRLILSDGVNSWIINKSSTTHKVLWEEAQRNLKNIARGDLNLKVSGEKWGDLIEKKGIIFEFGYTIKSELIKWFLGIDEAGKEIPDVSKIMINPDIVDQGTGVIYFYNNQDNKVYVSDTVVFGDAVNIEEIYSDVTGDQKNRVYTTFGSANIAAEQKAPPDILYVNSAPKYWTYFDYSCKIPDKAKNNDELNRVILGNEADRYNKSQDNKGTLQFLYSNNIYRFYSDGSLTYRYTDTASSSGKSDMGDALFNAYKFVDGINQLSNSSANIVLSDIVEKPAGVYNISFDYELNGMKVWLDPTLKTGNGETLLHAIRIKADSKRVLECTWLLRDFTQIGKGNYNDRFMDLMSLLGRPFDELEINDANSGYFIRSKEEAILKPTMLIDIKNQSILPIEMPAEKGD